MNRKDSPSYGGKLLYQYDKIGNMTYNCKYGYYYYDDPLHKHAVTRIVKNGQTIDTYTYDANGNMTSGAGRTLTYDYDNRPTSITVNGTAVVNVYDASGNRVRKMKSSPTEDITTYIGQLYECNSATGQCTKYIFAGMQRIAEIKGSSINYYHTDHLGSSSIITDSAGNKVEDIYYYPYGEIKTNTGSVNVKHKFAGHEYDAETGLIYMGARYYDPKLARFISADTIVPLPFYPQSLNRYSYAYNNPVVIVDLDGHCAFLAGNPTGTYHWVGNRSSGPSGNWASRAASRAWNAIKTGGQILITAAANLAGGFVATAAVHATGLATGYNTTAMNNVGNAIMNGANRFAVAIGGAVINPSGGGGSSGQQGNSGGDSNNMNLPPLRAPWEFFNDKPEDYAAVFPNGDSPNAWAQDGYWNNWDSSKSWNNSKPFNPSPEVKALMCSPVVTEPISFTGGLLSTYYTGSYKTGLTTYETINMILGISCGTSAGVPYIPVDPVINPPYAW